VLGFIYLAYTQDHIRFHIRKCVVEKLAMLDELNKLLKKNTTRHQKFFSKQCTQEDGPCTNNGIESTNVSSYQKEENTS